MNKINVKDINIESCEMVIDKRHYKVVEHHLVNHSRKVFYDDKNYYKIFDKEYCHRKNFIKAYESGFFDELAPALKALIMDGDEVVGYVTEVGERISKSPYTPIPKEFYEKVLDVSKEKNMFFYDLIPLNIIELSDGRLSLIDLERVYGLDELHIIDKHTKTNLVPDYYYEDLKN
jgi:hypothetical protein